MEGLSIAAIVFIVLVVVVLFSALKTVPQGYNWTIERFWTLYPHLNAWLELCGPHLWIVLVVRLI